MPGGGWKSMDFTNNQIPSSGQLDTQQRRFGDQLSRWFLRLLHGDTDPAAAGRTIGGWAATNVVGQLQATVTRGSGYHVDAALFGSDSALSVGETEDTTTLNFSAGPAPGNERIDVIACTMSQASGQNITVLQFGGGTLAQNFEFGGVATLAVVEGTPAAIGAAVAPAMGSGQQALWEVLVPASAANLDAATFTDVRLFAVGGNRLRDGLVATDCFTDVASGAIRLFDFENRTDGNIDSLDWSTNFGMPRFTRAVRAGESNGVHYPMMTGSGGRTWWLNVDLGSAAVVADASDGDATLTYVFTGDVTVAAPNNPAWVVAHASANANTKRIRFVVPNAQARGLELVSATLEYVVNNVHAGVGTTRVRMWHYDRSAGSSSAVMAALTLDNTVGTKNTGFTLTATPVIDTGDVLFGAIQWDFDASADTASTDINYLRLEFQEGRA